MYKRIFYLTRVHKIVPMVHTIIVISFNVPPTETTDHTNHDRKPDPGGGGGGAGGGGGGTTKSFEHTSGTTSSPPPHQYSSGSSLSVPRDNNPNLLSPEILNQRRGSRRPSILPVCYCCR